ncbi:hypothetical protein RirG_181180 [Rhizophagus irregularis DAOM 197198w]|uniref:Uncharacterized protein n=1 Tax=Rhizophagus irregularis (strain DAOM 197198w) TaxID=1432141 RepID=A0A015KKR6_RHIIW|nr:hypothetical protein RirG_181180 [Rhizophagus irregularis DAOM 197198w]
MTTNENNDNNNTETLEETTTVQQQPPSPTPSNSSSTSTTKKEKDSGSSNSSVVGGKSAKNVPSSTPAINIFSNDGSFLDRFKKMKAEEDEKKKQLEALERLLRIVLKTVENVRVNLRTKNRMLNALF